MKLKIPKREFGKRVAIGVLWIVHALVWGKSTTFLEGIPRFLYAVVSGMILFSVFITSWRYVWRDLK